MPHQSEISATFRPAPRKHLQTPTLSPAKIPVLPKALCAFEYKHGRQKFIVYQNYNEEDEAQNIINLAVNDGKSIALVSDAGSPLISDPGYRLVRKAREQNVFVTVLPGCCALVCALQLSGLPTNRFLFAGFIPNKDKARADTLKEVRDTKATIVFMKRHSGLSKP